MLETLPTRPVCRSTITDPARLLPTTPMIHRPAVFRNTDEAIAEVDIIEPVDRRLTHHELRGGVVARFPLIHWRVKLLEVFLSCNIVSPHYTPFVAGGLVWVPRYALIEFPNWEKRPCYSQNFSS